MGWSFPILPSTCVWNYRNTTIEYWPSDCIGCWRYTVESEHKIREMGWFTKRPLCGDRGWVKFSWQTSLYQCMVDMYLSCKRMGPTLRFFFGLEFLFFLFLFLLRKRQICIKILKVQQVRMCHSHAKHEFCLQAITNPFFSIYTFGMDK